MHAYIRPLATKTANNNIQQRKTPWYTSVAPRAAPGLVKPIRQRVMDEMIMAGIPMTPRQLELYSSLTISMGRSRNCRTYLRYALKGECSGRNALLDWSRRF